MPMRPFSRDRVWLLPPELGDLVRDDHPARFVASFVDSIDRAGWLQLGVDPDGPEEGAPAYHPRALLSVWLYGFMTRVRSSRALERACRDQIPYLWLTGWQQPDHNTLWRFYRDHREKMRGLLKRTVRTAVAVGLVDLAVQAVDGTKVLANAAKDRTFDRAELARLLERVDAAISDLEAQNVNGDVPAPPRLPEQLAKAQTLREQVLAALEQMDAEDRKQVNLTDGDASFMKGRQGTVMGYNAQAMVSPAASSTHQQLIITAADVVMAPDDHGQLAPMVDAAREAVGLVEATLADAGYHSGPNLEACAARSQQVVMPEAEQKAAAEPYHKDRFDYDPVTDSYTCPEGQRLEYIGQKQRIQGMVRIYRAARAVCQACPAFRRCVKSRGQGRSLEIGPHEAALRQHRAKMRTEWAKALYRLRKQIVEPVFGIIKEQLGARRFLLRGLSNVRAEWTLLATAFNLATLWRLGITWAGPGIGHTVATTAAGRATLILPIRGQKIWENKLLLGQHHYRRPFLVTLA